FQAEDGIRDKLVTGVQTCALPICKLRERVAGPETQDAEAGELEAVGGRERGGAAAAGPDEEVGLAARHLVVDAVHVADEGAVAAAGEHGAVAAIEHGPGDAAGVFEAAGEEE